MKRIERLWIRLMTKWGSISGSIGLKKHAVKTLMDVVRRNPSHLQAYQKIDTLIKGVESVRGIERYPMTALKKFCLFVGHGRSGHSLVGSLLDAHPSIIISHELDVLRTVGKVSFEELFRYIRYNSFIFAQKGRSWTGYNYQVENQYQGTLGGPLEILGDKKGGGTSKQLSEKPEALYHVRELIPCPIVFIHVIRNPFDSIATNAIRSDGDLKKAVDWYFLRAESVKWLQSAVPRASILDIYLDDFIEDPETILKKILNFLCVSTISEEYLHSCSERVYKKASITRNRVEWTDSKMQEIRSRCADYPYLSRFFDDP